MKRLRRGRPSEDLALTYIDPVEPLPTAQTWTVSDEPTLDVDIQRGRVRTAGLDLSAILAVAALLLGMYAATRPATSAPVESAEPSTTEPESEHRTTSIPVAPPGGYLCLDGQALRGITARGTAICTDLVALEPPSPAAPMPTSAAITAAVGDWCLRLDVLTATPHDATCGALHQ